MKIVEILPIFDDFAQLKPDIPYNFPTEFVRSALVHSANVLRGKDWYAARLIDQLLEHYGDQLQTALMSWASSGPGVEEYGASAWMATDEVDKIRSFLEQAEKNGWLPLFSVLPDQAFLLYLHFYH